MHQPCNQNKPFWHAQCCLIFAGTPEEEAVLAVQTLHITRYSSSLCTRHFIFLHSCICDFTVYSWNFFKKISKWTCILSCAPVSAVHQATGSVGQCVPESDCLPLWWKCVTLTWKAVQIRVQYKTPRSFGMIFYFFFQMGSIGSE